jgi:hypothetical protein
VHHRVAAHDLAVRLRGEHVGDLHVVEEEEGEGAGWGRGR